MKNLSLTCVILAGFGLAAGVGLGAQSLPGGSVAPASAGTVADGMEAGGSQVRIVRLSVARGSVQMDRGTGRGFEAAFVNIPVVAGSKLLTGDGIAEVEFEDNSSLRLTPGSEVEFPRLARSAAGVTLTTVRLTKGMAYVSLQRGKDAGEFVVTDGAMRATLTPGTHLRLDATRPEVELAVFDGSAQVDVGAAQTAVTRRQTVDLNPAEQTVSAVQKGTGETDWDEWDKSQAGYHKAVSGFAGLGGGNGLYGVNDLGYYGAFADLPGCGMVWRAYFASAAWDPFGNGIWSWFPASGFSWVSPYPWGWLPYHSGTWMSCGGAGWGWQPGGTWVGLRNHMLMRVAHHPNPHPMPPTPVKGAVTLVPVNTRPLTMSGITEDGKFTFRQDSAGLGVPREEFGKLGHVSTNVEQRGGAASRSVGGGFSGSGFARSGVGVSAGRVSSGSSTSSGRGYSGSSGGSTSMGASHSGGGGSVSGGGSSSAASGGSSGGGHH